jgi:hypothetical protein
VEFRADCLVWMDKVVSSGHSSDCLYHGGPEMLAPQTETDTPAEGPCKRKRMSCQLCMYHTAGGGEDRCVSLQDVLRCALLFHLYWGHWEGACLCASVAIVIVSVRGAMGKKPTLCRIAYKG